jgi:hypothetical protein
LILVHYFNVSSTLLQANNLDGHDFQTPLIFRLTNTTKILDDYYARSEVTSPNSRVEAQALATLSAITQ